MSEVDALNFAPQWLIYIVMLVILVAFICSKLAEAFEGFAKAFGPLGRYWRRKIDQAQKLMRQAHDPAVTDEAAHTALTKALSLLDAAGAIVPERLTANVTKSIAGIEYRLQDGRWHRVTPEESAAEESVSSEAVQAPQVVEHVTKKGKTLRGIIRTDLTKEKAQAIDAYTFRKDGGWFIREKHLAGAQTAATKIDATQAQAQTGPAPIASEALLRIADLYRVEADIRGRTPERDRIENP